MLIVYILWSRPQIWSNHNDHFYIQTKPEGQDLMMS